MKKTYKYVSRMSPFLFLPPTFPTLIPALGGFITEKENINLNIHKVSCNGWEIWNQPSDEN